MIRERREQSLEVHVADDGVALRRRVLQIRRRTGGVGDASPVERMRRSVIGDYGTWLRLGVRGVWLVGSRTGGPVPAREGETAVSYTAAFGGGLEIGRAHV